MDLPSGAAAATRRSRSHPDLLQFPSTFLPFRVRRTSEHRGFLAVLPNHQVGGTILICCSGRPACRLVHAEREVFSDRDKCARTENPTSRGYSGYVPSSSFIGSHFRIFVRIGGTRVVDCVQSTVDFFSNG